MQDYTEPSLNNRIREKAIRNESLDRNTEKNVKRSADVSGSGRRFCLFEFNYAGCEKKRLEAMTVRSLAVSGLEDRAKSFTVRRIWV